MKEIPEELLPVIEWWEKDGKQTLVLLAVVAAVIGGFYGFKNWRAAQRSAAADAVMSAYTAEELEDAVAKYGSLAAGPALKQRLAKKYFDDGKYQEALDLYTALDGKAADGFEDVPAVGAAQCLEALGKYAEAGEKFDAFVAAKPESCFALTAKLGSARCLCQDGKKDDAVKALEALKAELKDDDAAVARIEATLDAVKRWEKRESRSLFDAANALAEKVGETAAAAETVAPAAPAAAEPAPEAAPAAPAAEEAK